MVCTTDDLLGWKDFPKGLRVLLLDEDSSSAVQIKSKLEEMDYIVSTFCDENEALLAISRRPESFHVAIVEVILSNSDGSLKFLETAKDLPIIMTSKNNCLSTMMKCIALGAAEFLQKPLSEEKLKNIWQHVVHKAFNAGDGTTSKSLKPFKETIASMVSIQQDNNQAENQNFIETENLASIHECEHDQSTVSDKFSAPSTPQLKQGSRFLDDGDCQDQPNCLIEKECEDQEEESKSVEITSNDAVVETTHENSLTAEVTVKVDPSLISTEEEAMIKEEDSPEGSSKAVSDKFPHDQQNKEGAMDSNIEVAENLKKASLHPNSCGNRANKKKVKVDWTPELHKRFVQAVDQLGIDQAIPSRILELMKAEGLTRHNVASHLQKYRMHRRHIIPREEDRRWQHPRDHMRRVYPQKPIVAYPPYHPNHSLPTPHFYSVWGNPSSHPPGFPMWGHHPGFPSSQPPECWIWKTHPGTYVDAWGCPVTPPSQAPYSTFTQVPNAWGFHNFGAVGDAEKSSFDFYPADDVIDAVVKEAISKPWLPLPLGLKPPSTESVLSELHRQGICNLSR